MNKHIFYIAAACVALASCVKNEVRVDAPDQEITFQTVSTKAGGTPFDTDHKFYSYAYFLEKGKKWEGDNLLTDAKPYINNALISHQNGPSGHFWAATDIYYWPKQGSLTFFAWTDDTAAPSDGTVTNEKVTCAQDTGIKITGYSVKDNRNKDILVAEIAKEETFATCGENGVPTVFRHALAKVEFNVNKKIDDTKVKFRVTSITLNNVSTKGTFTQGSPSESWGWSGQTEPGKLPVFTSTTGVEVTEIAGPAPAKFDGLKPNADEGDYFIVLPQDFNNDTPTLTIEYEIITNYTGTEVKETVTETKALKDIYKSNWECKKNYILGITLGLNEIYWVPSVEPWVDSAVTTDIH